MAKSNPKTAAQTGQSVEKPAGYVTKPRTLTRAQTANSKPELLPAFGSGKRSTMIAYERDPETGARIKTKPLQTNYVRTVGKTRVGNAT